MSALAALAALLALSAPEAALAAKTPAARPNILLILADDLGYGDLGFQGGKDIPTPNLDALAAAGVRCTSGYVSGPYCSPTRAGLMTGRYQQRYGHEFNPGPPKAGRDTGLVRAETAIAERLTTAGYRCGMVGKWHLGHAEGLRPTDRGFASFFGFYGGAHPYFTTAAKTLRDDLNAIRRGTEPVDEPEYLTEAFAREATAFLRAAGTSPWFLYLPFNAVHNPLQAPEKYLSRFADLPAGRKTYAAMLSAMDDAVGNVLAELKRQKLDEKTLVFFLSDNGGTPANKSDNGPLAGHKGSVWEGGVRVPFVVRWTGTLPAGKVYNKPVIQLDILPTALAAAGVAIDPAWKLDGVDLLPYLKGSNGDAPHQYLYWRFGGQAAIRGGDWKLSLATARRKNHGQPIDLSAGALYNLAEDIGEQTDRSAAEPERVRQLAAAWQQWNAELVEPSWTPGIKAKKAKDGRPARKAKVDP